MPTPPQFLVGKKSDSGVFNIRNPNSPQWRYVTDGAIPEGALLKA